MKRITNNPKRKPWTPERTAAWLKLNERVRPPLDPAKFNQIVTLGKQGLSCREISRRLGVSVSTASKYRRPQEQQRWQRSWTEYEARRKELEGIRGSWGHAGAGSGDQIQPIEQERAPFHTAAGGTDQLATLIEDLEAGSPVIRWRLQGGSLAYKIWEHCGFDGRKIADFMNRLGRQIPTLLSKVEFDDVLDQLVQMGLVPRRA